MSFEKLSIRPELVKALSEEKIDIPTEIQEKSIPIILSGKDVIGISKTGSGKTVAFGIPMLNRLEKGHNIKALIISPTRELTVQISRELKKFNKYLDFRITTVYGGVAINPQIDALEKADIVVGTPGRLLDHLERGTIDLSGIEMFVLDEADKMVEMGFIEDITKILSQAPDSRQILLFGATISNEIAHLRDAYMHDPEVVKAELHVKEDFLEQFYYELSPHEKFSYLVHTLKREDTKRVIIFCSARSTVDIVAENLRRNGIHAGMLHGKLSQNKRQRVMDDFNRGRPPVLVASAVAARGLDIRDVTHVINYDLSLDPQEYIHRIGRTARAGERGKAITLLCDRDHEAFRSILGRYDMDIKRLPEETFDRVSFKAKQPGRRRFEGSPRRGGPRRQSGGYHGIRKPHSNRSFGHNKPRRSNSDKVPAHLEP